MRLVATVLALLAAPAAALEPREWLGWTLVPSLEMRLGLQWAEGINYGFGAIDTPGETRRSALAISLEPRLALSRALGAGEFYGGVSLVGATTQLDGELSGQFARAGSKAVETEDAFFGWRTGSIDVSVGAQTYTVGDGLVIGNGNFDTGPDNGNFWVGPFDAWRNSAIIKLALAPGLAAEAFWLRADDDFGDARVVGANLKSIDHPRGRFGAMVLQVLEGSAFNFDGVKLLNLRALDVKLPAMPSLTLYGELILQRGRDVDGGGVDNRGLGGYLEAAWQLPGGLAWAPVLTYRYAYFSGDDPETPRNEGYRSMFFGFYLRAWDTWYQGEVAGEYHLFNQNQVTQMLKLRTFPRRDLAATVYWYRHDLAERNYFGVPLDSRAWADEINAGVEYFRGERIYIYAGMAWSKPDRAAEQFFGDDEGFAIVQTWMRFRF